MWIVTGTARSSGPASIITGRAGTPVQAADKVPRNSVWPGCRKPGSVERLLADGIGDHRRGVAGTDVADGAGDRLDDRGGIRRVGPARLCRDRGLKRHDRQRVVEHRDGIARLDRTDRAIEAEQPGAVGDEVRVGEEVEGRNAEPLGVPPYGKGEVGPDTAGFAHRQGQRR